MSIKVTYNSDKKTYYKDGEAGSHPKFNWKKVEIDNAFGRDISVLTAERIGVSMEDQDSPFSFNISINGSTFVTSNREDIILTVDIEDEDGQVIDASDKDIQWSVNDGVISNNTILSLKSSDLKDRHNNIIRVTCIVDEFELEDSISILKYVGFSGDGGGNEVGEPRLILSDDTVSYDLRGNIINDTIVASINNYDSIRQDNDIIEFLIDGKKSQSGSNIEFTIPKNKLPSYKDNITISVRVKNNNGIIFEDSKDLWGESIDVGSGEGTEFGRISILTNGSLRENKEIAFLLSFKGIDLTPEIILDGFGRGQVKNVEWNFGDGTTKISPKTRISHTYENSGTYIVRATYSLNSDKKYIAKKIIKIND